MAKKYTIRKFDGDDAYSWAVFRKDDLPKGHRGPVWHGEAQPVMCGCSRHQARAYANDFERMMSELDEELKDI